MWPKKNVDAERMLMREVIMNRMAKIEAFTQYKMEMREAAMLLNKIQRSLDIHMKKASKDPSNWGYVGELASFKKLLKEALEILVFW